MDSLIDNLDRIARELEAAPEPASLGADAMMKHYMQVMRWALYLLRLTVSIAPGGDADAGYSRDQAVLVGLMVRIVKLYDALYQNIAKRQLEICGILLRTLTETETKLRYLISRAPEGHGAGNFVLASYKAEREMLDHLESIAEPDRTPIERRMLRSIENELANEGIALEELRENRKWQLDGKSMRGLLQSLQEAHLYPFAYGGPSRWVHGGWGELRRYHLHKEEDGSYTPRLDFGDPDPRLAGPATVICLNVALQYLEWAHETPQEAAVSLIEGVLSHVQSLDNAHEASL